MAIELKFISSISETSSNKGSSVPPWFGNENDYNSWYISPEVFYYYNMLQSTSMNTMYIQYGRNQQGWGSGRFFVQELEILSQEENDDGSITVNVRSRLRQFIQRRTETTSQGFNVQYNLKILSNTVFTYNGTSSDNISQSASNWYTKTFTVQPQQTINETAVEFSVHYPNGDATDSDLFIGFGLFNPNPITYKPMAIRKNNSWQSLNRTSGFIGIRKSNIWESKALENIANANKVNSGKNRIRKSGNWIQLPPMN